MTTRRCPLGGGWPPDHSVEYDRRLPTGLPLRTGKPTVRPDRGRRHLDGKLIDRWWISGDGSSESAPGSLGRTRKEILDTIGMDVKWKLEPTGVAVPSAFDPGGRARLVRTPRSWRFIGTRIRMDSRPLRWDTPDRSFSPIV